MLHVILQRRQNLRKQSLNFHNLPSRTTYLNIIRERKASVENDPLPRPPEKRWEVYNGSRNLCQIFAIFALKSESLCFISFLAINLSVSRVWGNVSSKLKHGKNLCLICAFRDSKSWNLCYNPCNTISETSGRVGEILALI